jgi:hypothetical protein
MQRNWYATSVSLRMIIRLALVLVSLSLICHGDQSPEARQESDGHLCRFDSVSHFGGWTVPGLVGSAPTDVRRTFPNAPGLTALRLRPAKTSVKLAILRCSRRASGRIDFELTLVKTLELWRCEFRGRIFAYAASYEPQHIEGGERRGTLGFVPVIFYDIDGSGKFSIMRYPGGTLLDALEVPEWAKAE